MTDIEKRAKELAVSCEATKDDFGYGYRKGLEEGYIIGATKQEVIDDAERKSLIEKVIWLIEYSYPDTVMWTHSELVENVMEDLKRRTKELQEMFG